MDNFYGVKATFNLIKPSLGFIKTGRIFGQEIFKTKFQIVGLQLYINNTKTPRVRLKFHFLAKIILCKQIE